ncbi:PilN domain-containing protein [Pokkaliibacter sp. CJK22405]|uniref:PilN domain-containing protein n=1 Tax=Pokkaliibacter sp. CJK22405 TaxID=3384615 RepID=UPI003984B182
MRINLLPWREERTELRKKQFNNALAVALLAAAGCVGGYWLWQERNIEVQQGRNQFLKQQITILDRKAGELTRLQEKQQQLEERISVINGLQADRQVMVRLMSDVVRMVPDKVFLTSLRREGNKVTMQGRAATNLQVSTFLRNLDGNDLFSSPQLSKVTKADQPVGWMNFDLSVTLNMPGASADDADKGSSNGK